MPRGGLVCELTLLAQRVRAGSDQHDGTGASAPGRAGSGGISYASPSICHHPAAVGDANASSSRRIR
jgi:hypothetical protein